MFDLLNKLHIKKASLPSTYYLYFDDTLLGSFVSRKDALKEKHKLIRSFTKGF